jgi:hypothetical protein
MEVQNDRMGKVVAKLSISLPKFMLKFNHHCVLLRGGTFGAVIKSKASYMD